MKAYRKIISLLLAGMLMAVFVIGTIHSVAEEGQVTDFILNSKEETNENEMIEDALSSSEEEEGPESSEAAIVEETSDLQDALYVDEPVDIEGADTGAEDSGSTGVDEEVTLSTDHETGSADAEIEASDEPAGPEVSEASNTLSETEAVKGATADFYDEESYEEVVLFSMLPLRERTVYLTIPADMDIAAIPVSWLIRNLQYENGDYVQDIPPNADIVWNFLSENSWNMVLDNYQKLSQKDTIDLSSLREYGVNQKIDMLVGSGEQLDGNMIRYFINIDLSAQEDQLEFELWQEDAKGVRTLIESIKSAHATSFGSSVNGYHYGSMSGVLYFNNFDIDFNTYKYYLGIRSILAQNPNYKVDISVNKQYVTASNNGSLGHYSVDGSVVNCDMSIPGNGIQFVEYDIDTEQPAEISTYKRSINYDFTMYYSDPTTKRTLREDIIHLCALSTGSTEHDNYGGFPSIYQYQNGEKIKVAEPIGSTTSDKKNETYNESDYINYEIIYKYQLNSAFDPNANCYFTVSFVPTNATFYEGFYPTVREVELQGEPVENANDKEFELRYDPVTHEFSNNCYTYRVTSGGVRAHKLVLIGQFQEGEYFYSDAFDSPVIGAQDPYFQVQGVNLDGRSLDAYVIENGKAINMDTYYGYGYQTILVNEYLTDEEMARLQPVFSTGNYSGTRLRTETGTEDLVSGVSAVDFSNVDEPVHLIASITDQDGRERAKNYYVRVVSKHTGPKLYVYDGWQQLNEDGTYSNLREVMLDEYFEEKHDILFANVGDGPLTGIKVTFTGTGAKLDEYWTVNSYPFGTLNPFTQTTDKSEYGYIDNIGKIRLIPDGSNEVIEGYVTISANGQEDVVVHVSGLARQPRIMTSKLGDTVKYVPYSFFISTNNMYDWNTQTFRIIDGELPPGMSLNENTGEIYGAPLSAGTYTFTVQADFAYERFEASKREYTIVVADNEDATVFFTSDAGYAIVPMENGEIGYVGEEESAYRFVYIPTGEDEVYISGGLFYRFVKLWLNGQELVRDVDYTAEDGSTRITIAAQTMATYVVDGRNTISAEFNVEGADSERGINLKRTSQNFYYDSSIFHVMFDVNGHGTAPQAQEVRYGEKVINPDPLFAAGYQFDGWYADEALSNLYDFSAPVKADITIYAKWSVVEEPTSVQEEPTEPVTKEEETSTQEPPTEPSTSDNTVSAPVSTIQTAPSTTGTNPQTNPANTAGNPGTAVPNLTTLHDIGAAFAAGRISFFEMVDFTYALKHGTTPAVGETVRYFTMGN